MFNRPVILFCLIAVADLNAQTIVANYRNDFNESGAPAAGWSYLWNAPSGWAIGTTGDQASGIIGAPDGYRALILANGVYTPDGDNIGTNNAPAGFLRLSATGGQTGPHNGSVNKHDRYAIAAFTVPQDGHYVIENSFITVNNANSDGVEVLVFPGIAEAVFRTLAEPTTTTAFDTEIGYFDAGQTIYIAFGPGETAAFDAFLMDFDIVHYERLSLRDQLLNGIALGDNPITLIPGRYYANPTGAYIRVNNFNPTERVTIVADGVELILQSGNRALGFHNSSNFILQGLSVDYDPQLYRQGTVESINNNTFELRLHEGYPQTLTSNANSGIIYEPVNRRIKQLTDTLYPTAVNQIEPGLFAVINNFRPANLQVGDYVSFTEPHNVPHTLYLENCSDVLYTDVEVYGAPAFALLSRDGYKLTMDNVRVIPGPTPVRASVPRLLSSNADGLHFKSSLGEIHIRNCHLAYNGDDSIVLTGAYSPILQKSSGNVITVSTKNRAERLLPGDPLYLYNPNSGTREEAIVQSVSPSNLTREEIHAIIRQSFPVAILTNSTFMDARVVTLTNSVNTPVGGLITNRNGESSGFTVTDNYVENTRARGILIKASNGVVRNNVVFNTLLPGIQLRPDAGTFLEGDFAQNILIENNELRRCALRRISSFAPIYVSANGFDNWTPGSGHSNITIRHNRIFNAPGASIVVEYADNVQIRSNRYITSHNITGTVPWYDSVIRLSHANAVSVVGINLAMGINQNNANLNNLIRSAAKVTNLDVKAEVLLDSDQDGLPDEWELQYFGHPTAANPNADPDGDGLTNAQEFLAQLDPLTPDAFTIRLHANGAGQRIRWTPRTNRFITIHTTDSLNNPFSILAEDIPAETGIYQLPPLNDASSLFYRIKITD